MFTRFNPQARSSFATKPSSMPFVVIERSFKPGTAAIPLTISQTSFRIKGSPPVSLILEMPRLTATLRYPDNLFNGHLLSRNISAFHFALSVAVSALKVAALGNRNPEVKQRTTAVVG